MSCADSFEPKGCILGSSVEQFTRKVFIRVVTSLVRTLRDEDLTVVQIVVIQLLDTDGAARITALVKTLDVSVSATSRLIDELVRRGMVSRVEDSTDRRAKTLELTARGRQVVDR